MESTLMDNVRSRAIRNVVKIMTGASFPPTLDQKLRSGIRSTMGMRLPTAVDYACLIWTQNQLLFAQGKRRALVAFQFIEVELPVARQSPR